MSDSEISTELIEKRRFPRFPVDFPAILQTEDNFLGIKGQINNLSESGSCLSLASPVPESPYVKVQIDPVSISSPFTIEAKIMWRDEVPQKGYKYGVKFVKLTDGEAFTLKKILERVQTESSLDPQFVKITQSCREFLGRIEDYCNKFDSHEPTERQKIVFVENEKGDVFSRLNNYTTWLQNIASKFSPEEYKRHVKYLQKEVIPFFIRESTVVNKQIYEKPFGYAGDYVVANYFYEDGYTGTNTYGKLIDRYTLETPTARAHRNRRKYFYNLMKQTINDLQDKEIKISSYACGPAVEMIDILKSEKPLKKVFITCIDGEPLALKQIKEQIKGLKGKTSRKFKVNIINENVLKMVKKKEPNKRLSNQDLIYVAGFIDYLPDLVTEKTIRYLYSLLKKDGKLVVVNVSAENPIRVYLEAFGEWYLHHRTPEQMMKLAEKLTDASDIHVELEPETKMNLFLCITK